MKPNGGPAFPRSGSKDDNGNQDYPEPGMSLRDYFAAQALKAHGAIPTRHDSEQASEIARSCYAMADALLAERETP